MSIIWLGSIANAMFAFLTQALSARTLGASEYGVFASAFAMVMLLAPIAGLGVSQFWLKVFGEEGYSGVRWLQPSYKFAAISSVIVSVSLLLWASQGPHSSTTESAIGLLVVVVWSHLVVDLTISRYQLEERYGWQAFAQTAQHMVRFLATLLVVYLCDSADATAIAGAFALSSAVILLLFAKPLAGLIRGDLNLIGHKRNHANRNSPTPTLREVLGGSWPFGVAGIAYLMFYQSDVVLVEYLVDSKTAGLYNAAVLVLTAVYLLPTVAYQRFLLPKLHRWWYHDRSTIVDVTRLGSALMTFIGVTTGLLLFLLADVIVELVFGAGYSEASVVLKILALGVPCRLFAVSIGGVLATGDHMRWKVTLMLVAAAANVTMNLLLIPHFGGIGAAYATVISELILSSLYLSAVRKAFGAPARKEEGELHL